MLPSYTQEFFGIVPPEWNLSDHSSCVLIIIMPDAIDVAARLVP